MSRNGGISGTLHFNPRSPRGERRSEERGRDGGDGFQSTLPSRGATASLLLAINPMQFQSTLPSRGATPMSIMRSIRFKNFNPRSPRGERQKTRAIHCSATYFNPRSPRGERQFSTPFYYFSFRISIHAPLAGSDELISRIIFISNIISIHAPLAGSDADSICKSYGGDISIHAPLAGSDGSGFCTASLRSYISIHAPLAGSDSERGSDMRKAQINFNPRSPRGERPNLAGSPLHNMIFQSTLPSRGATKCLKPLVLSQYLFQSTLPSRGATKGGGI